MSTAATDMDATSMEVTSTEVVVSTEAASTEATSTEATTTEATSTQVTPSLTNPVKKKSHKKAVYSHSRLKKCVIVKQGDVENSFTMDNIRRICRGCFTTTDLNCLFESSYKGERLNVILQKGFGINIARSSRITTNICSTCIKKIGQFYKFVCKFRTSETVLVTSLHALEGNVSPEVNVLIEKETEPPNVVPITHINHSYSTDSIRTKRNYVKKADSKLTTKTTTNPTTLTVKKLVDNAVVVISDDEETDKVVSEKTGKVVSEKTAKVVSEKTDKVVSEKTESNKGNNMTATSAIKALPLPLKSISTVGTEITPKTVVDKNQISEIIKTVGVKRGLEMGKKVEFKLRKINDNSTNQPSISMPLLDENSVDIVETENSVLSVSSAANAKPTTIVILEYSCTKCVRHYPTKEELNLHEIQAHRQQMCDICQKICIGQKQLKRHFLGVHTLKNSIVCAVCRRIFGVKDNYFVHKKNNCKDAVMATAVQKEKPPEVNPTIMETKSKILGERTPTQIAKTVTKMKRKMSKLMEENNSSPSKISTTMTEVESIIDTTMAEVKTSPSRINKTIAEITPSEINTTLTEVTSPSKINKTLAEITTTNTTLTDIQSSPSINNTTLTEVKSTPSKIDKTLSEIKSTQSNINTTLAAPSKVESTLGEINIASILLKLTPPEVNLALAAVKAPSQEVITMLSEINTITKESTTIKGESSLTKPESLFKKTENSLTMETKSKTPPSVIKLSQSNFKAVLAAVKQSKTMKISSPKQVITPPSEIKITTESTITTNTESLLTPPTLIKLTKSDITAAMEAAKQPKTMKIASINKTTGFAKVRTDLLKNKVNDEGSKTTPTILNSGGNTLTTVLNLQGRNLKLANGKIVKLMKPALSGAKQV